MYVMNGKLTRFPLSDDHPTAVQDFFQLLQLEVSVGLVVRRARRYQRLLDGELDDKCLTQLQSV